jgi:hypothetical protein
MEIAISEHPITDVTHDALPDPRPIEPGSIVLHRHDPDAWGIVVSMKNEGWITVLWSIAPDDYIDWEDYD